VAVDPDPDSRRLEDVVDHVADPRWQHPAVRVAQRDHLGARVVRRAQHLECVVAVVAVAVEEVLGVEEHPLALVAQVRDGVADHRQVLLQRGAQCQLHVPVVRLGDQRHDAGTAVPQGRDQWVVGRRDPGPSRRTEGGQRRVAQLQLLTGPPEELGVLGVGARPTALDVADTEPVQLPGDVQLVRDREVETLLLRAVAQGGVVDVERVRGAGHRTRSFRSLLWSGNKKTSRGYERSARQGSRRAS
jgi:hypothetical protein